MANNRGIRSTVRAQHLAGLKADVDFAGFKMGLRGAANPVRQLSALTNDASKVASQSATLNRNGHALTAMTLVNSPATKTAIGNAAESLSQYARLSQRQQHTQAQSAWLSDIMKPTGAAPTAGARVAAHLQNSRRLDESAKVFDTMSMTAHYSDFPVDFTVVKRGARVEGMMQSTHFDMAHGGAAVRSANTAIGFLGTHPRNITEPNRAPGVGAAMIGRARALGVAANSAAVTLGAEGKEAQGFYRHQGFRHQDGRALAPTDFIHGTLPLKLPLR
jgi:hypothetical protein